MMMKNNHLIQKVTDFERGGSEKEDGEKMNQKMNQMKKVKRKNLFHKENQKTVNFLKKKVDDDRDLLDEDKQKLVDECLEKIEELYDDNERRKDRDDMVDEKW